MSVLGQRAEERGQRGDKYNQTWPLCNGRKTVFGLLEIEADTLQHGNMDFFQTVCAELCGLNSPGTPCTPGSDIK